MWKCALSIMACCFTLTQNILLISQATFICPQRVWSVWQQTLEMGCKLKTNLIHHDRKDLTSVQRRGIFTLCKQLFFGKGAVNAQCKLTSRYNQEPKELLQTILLIQQYRKGHKMNSCLKFMGAKANISRLWFYFTWLNVSKPLPIKMSGQICV